MEIRPCTESCPDCGICCDLPYGHASLHSSTAHNIKERCLCVAESEEIEYEVGEESKKAIRQFKAGEAAKFESCEHSCVLKGRGHTHPVECKGGASCLGVTLSGRAVHSKDHYYPDLIYDSVECETYWHLNGWEPPVLKKSPMLQHLFALCPFYYVSAEHMEKIFCMGRLFHSNSTAYKDHVFPF